MSVRDVRSSKTRALDFFNSIIKVVVGEAGHSETLNDVTEVAEDGAASRPPSEGSSEVEKGAEAAIYATKSSVPRQKQNVEPSIFWVHEGLICARSEFFQKAMNGSWKESDEKVVELPEDDPASFELYMQLLYTKELPISRDPELRPKKGDGENEKLCSLYVLAEKLQDTETKDIVIDALIARTRKQSEGGKYWYPGPGSIEIIYEGTPESSPARRLLADFFVDNLELDFPRQDVSTIPKDFFVDVAVQALKRRPLPVGKTTQDCDHTKYHCEKPPPKDQEES